MAIGDTVQAGLGRMDFSAFQRAGEAQARANQAFGNAIGGVVEKYYQKKQEKQEREEREQAYRKMGFSAEEAKAASGDKDLANQFMNKLNADRNYQLRLDELAMRQQSFKSQQDMLDEQKALNESLAKFSMQPVKTPTPEFSALQQEYRPEQIPGTPEFIAMEESEPMGARPSIIAKTITEQPDFQRFVKQDSPAVAQLPDSFKPQGRRIQEAVESGELSNQAGMIAINNLVGEVAKPPTINEQIALDKRREEIEEKEEQKASEKIESTNNLTDFYTETKSLLDKINEKGVDVTGPIEGTSIYRFFSKLGDTDDEQVRRRLEMFTRKLTLDAAQNLKGALSDKDIRFLVEQAPDMDDNPSVWKKYMGDLVLRLERNAKQKGIELDDIKPPQQSSNTIDPANIQSEIERKKQMLRARQMNAQYFDNPNVPNVGNINSGN